MIANTSLQSFSVPTRSAAVAGTASSSAQDANNRSGQTAAGTGRSDPPTMAMSGTRGTLLDRWA